MNKFLRATNNSVKIIYISTDAVFNSSAHLANEKNCIEPQSIYGKSKELGEFFLLNSTRDYLILRTTIVGLNSYTNNKSFLEWIINSVKTKQRISLFNDVLFSPITIWCLISEIIFLISQNLICSKIFHIAGGQTMTKYEFGKSIIEELSLDKDFIMEGSISELKEKAKRSKDQSLDSSYYQNTFNRRLPDIKDTITIIKNKINE
jgi:dTDP-4-dehydrorhamnose reductase